MADKKQQNKIRQGGVGVGEPLRVVNKELVQFSLRSKNYIEILKTFLNIEYQDLPS